MVFALLERALTFFAMIILMLSNCHTFEAILCSFYKLLQALIVFHFEESSLQIIIKWLILHVPGLLGGLNLGALST